MRLEIHEARAEQIAAEALLLPVDGLLCRLGGASAGALRAALRQEERADEMEYVEEELARLKPLIHPAAAVIDGVAHWPKLLVSAAYPHSVDGIVYSSHDCACMIRAAVPVALSLAGRHAIESVVATVIGTAYRMPADLAVRAFLDGVAAAEGAVIVRWSIPDPVSRDLAVDAAKRVGLLHG